MRRASGRPKHARMDGRLRTNPWGTLGLALALAGGVTAQAASTARERFVSLSGTFALEVPAGFRQLAPGEALKLGERGDTPLELCTTTPRVFYAIGQVDRWLAHGLESPWIYVMEQDAEWHIDGDFATLVTERWRENGELTDRRQLVSDVREAEIGPGRHPVHVAHRTVTPRDGRPIRCIDVYAPTGGREITLSFCAWADEFETWRNEFEHAMATLTFARPARGEAKLSDRLWTPLLTGGLVGLVLLGLYKHTRRSR
ncbi:MAG: hypothetical protein KDE27_30565 [Planctomycetes bacterium]|nr:hypothetical protein [Planctomycetota bacterium]